MCVGLNKKRSKSQRFLQLSKAMVIELDRFDKISSKTLLKIFL